MTQVRTLLTTEAVDPKDYNNNKVRSIKLIRQETGLGLFESKCVMDYAAWVIADDPLAEPVLLLKATSKNRALRKMAEQIAA